ncbi:phospholipase C, phosphocholine-specific [Endozoicomonas sp. 4G]|uniref:phosphocholine-specific phospholipase C n=1 Tax=Endozoicomonas sp. 4G TaxID=2872754 RepID=UPI002078E919|nr:phospholipase C, phosphocholine-specific [Endozoicomonas sp. 4G]
MKTSLSRRKFLKASGVGLTGATASGLFPASIAKALAIPANNVHGNINDVEHVVILMQENRAFDNYFGKLAGVRGFADRHPIPTVYGDVWQQKYEKRRDERIIYPYHLDADQGNAQRVYGTPHTYPDAHEAWDQGRMSDWPTYKQQQSMGYYTEAELPFQVALADAFTICDEYYCSFQGGTNPNRLYHWTGTNNHPLDPNPPAIFNDYDSLGPSSEGYTWTTYPERLEQAGVSWKVYQNLPDNYTDNPLAGFRQYREANELKGNESNGDPYPTWTEEDNNISPLLKGVANTMDDGGFLASLNADIANKTLPQVSWIVAPAAYSEHPGPSSPVQGGWYTQEVLNALTRDEDIWSKTVLIVNFDENDGFFDHMPPPCPPTLSEGAYQGDSTVDTTGEYHTDNQPYGPGPRVPALIISPWSRGGWVNSQVFDHTSVLQFLEKRFGVIEENISPFRRAVCGDLTSAFNFENPNDEPLPPLPETTRCEADEVRAEQELLPQVEPPLEDDQLPPVAPAGARPSRALPYELHVNATVDVDQYTVLLTMTNSGQQGAVIHVYDQLNLDAIPRRFVIGAGDTVRATWVVSLQDNKYDLWVLSANGFHRQFKGTCKHEHNQEVSVCYGVNKETPSVLVRLENNGDSEKQVTVDFSAYQPGYQKTVTLEAGGKTAVEQFIKPASNWYDLVVRDESGDMFRRYCGRVENGTHGYSDPLMGE